MGGGAESGEMGGGGCVGAVAAMPGSSSTAVSAMSRRAAQLRPAASGPGASTNTRTGFAADTCSISNLRRADSLARRAGGQPKRGL